MLLEVGPSQGFEEILPVHIVQEDVLAPVTATHDMVNRLEYARLAVCAAWEEIGDFTQSWSSKTELNYGVDPFFPLSVSCPFHARNQIATGRLDEQVKMIGHQTPGNAPARRSSAHASPRDARKSWRSAASWKISSRRSPRFIALMNRAGVFDPAPFWPCPTLQPDPAIVNTIIHREPTRLRALSENEPDYGLTPFPGSQNRPRLFKPIQSTVMLNPSSSIRAICQPVQVGETSYEVVLPEAVNKAV